MSRSTPRGGKNWLPFRTACARATDTFTSPALRASSNRRGPGARRNGRSGVAGLRLRQMDGAFLRRGAGAANRRRWPNGFENPEAAPHGGESVVCVDRAGIGLAGRAEKHARNDCGHDSCFGHSRRHRLRARSRTAIVLAHRRRAAFPDEAQRRSWPLDLGLDGSWQSGSENKAPRNSAECSVSGSASF